MADTIKKLREDHGQAIALLKEIITDTGNTVGRLDKEVAVLEVRLNNLCKLVDSLTSDVQKAREKGQELDGLLDELKQEALGRQVESSNRTKIIVASLSSFGAVVGSILTILMQKML